MVLRFYRLMGVVCGLALTAGTAASGVSSGPRWTLDHFQHRAYTVNDGLPQDGTTLIAQTADGLIWLAAPDGLMTFDGNRFRHFDPLPGEHLTSTDITRMMAPSSGGLWVSYRAKGEGFIRDGHITNVPPDAGDKGNQPSYLFQDRTGNAWAAGEDGWLYRFDGARWKRTQVRVPEQARGVVTDSHFNVWVVGKATGTIYRRLEKEGAFRDMGVRVPEGFSLSVPADDTVFVASLSRQMFRFRVAGNALVECGAPLPGLGFGVLADRHGGGWMATVTDGVHYFPSLAALCATSPLNNSDVALLSNKSTGASGDLAMMALVDREGNIWSTSEGGLDRLTPSAFSKVRFPRTINMATIAAAGDGSLWVGNESADIFHYAGGVAASAGVAPSALALGRAPETGQVLAASTTGIWALGDRPERVAPLPSAGDATYAAAIYQAPRREGGDIWLAVGDTVYRYRDNAWQAIPGAGWVRAIYGGSQGAVWLAGRGDDALAAHTPSGIRAFGPRDGLDVGEVKVVAEGPGGTWVAGGRGVQLLGERGFHHLSLRDVAPPDAVTGMLFDEDGNLWIHAINGLYRIRAAAVTAFVASKNAPVPAEVLTASDGLPGLASQQHSLPSLIKGNDGRLWVQGGSTVAWVDPRDLPVRPLPSDPVILGVTTGPRRAGPGTATVQFTRDQRNPVFSYAAPATTDATRVRFQTRLTGFDDTWVDQGTHREAGYPRLAAGHYVFAVRASPDGVHWTADPPQLAITIAPFFYETGWFRAACVLAALGALWLLVRWETRRALRRYQARTRIRMEEREAIARDLHDTLLQSNLALVLQLEAISQRTSDGDTRVRVAALAERANAAVTEGRIRVTALRERLDGQDSLGARLQDLGAQLASHSQTRFRFAVEGEPRLLRVPEGDEVRLLLSEAMTNAFRHAQAKEVSVTVSYGFWRFRATVRDDGLGMSGMEPGSGTPEGHWGIRGMRERASGVSGRLVICPVEPTGTGVCIVVPARRLYAR